jgi:organizing structure protein 2
MTYQRPAYAEAPEPDVRKLQESHIKTRINDCQLPIKKPIYSDPPTAPTTPKPSPTSPVSKPNPMSPTPTDRLTAQVKKVRLFLYDQSLAAENGVNSLMSWAFKQETSFTNTIASLAPSPETGEQLLPGAIYVLVATLGGTIVTRNRGIFLRATFPLAVGIAAGWVLIPVTMQNIADLSWEYEQKVPVVSNTHAQISGFTRDAWKQTKVHAKMVTQWADETTGESRKKIESWVEKGR